MAQHGFARTSIWDIESTDHTDTTASVTLVLTASSATKALWPHEFTLRYVIQLTNDELTCSLNIANPIHGTSSFMCQSLLHTYFLIHNVAELSVSGFQGRTYSDKLKNGELSVDDRPLATISEEVDRVYTGHEDGNAYEIQLFFPSISAVPTAAASASSPSDNIRVVASATINMNHTTNSSTTSVVPCDVVFWNPWIGSFVHTINQSI